MLQSLPPTTSSAPAHAAPVVPPGQGALALSARFGRDLPFINGGLHWRIYPDKPVSQKPAEVRMGNGKGNPEYFVTEIQPGKIIFEMDGITQAIAKEAFALAAAKLPFRTIVVQRMLGG